MKKKLLPLFCALALLLALALPAQSSGGLPPVYILAVNDKFCDLPGGALPMVVNDVLYVPYSVFDKNATGVDLGVYYGVGLGKGTTITLYSSSPDLLIFTVNRGICQDGNGNTMPFRGMVRNAIPYVPAAAVCDFFGLHYSFLPTPNRGILIRISNDAATMSDSQFLSAGAQAMSTRYNSILQSMDLPEVPVVTPTPPTPTPTPGGQKGDVRVYLAVDAANTAGDLPPLFSSGVQALFLFSPETLPQQAALARWAVAQGHSVGLTVSGSEEEALAQLEQGNALLTHIARTRTRIVSAPAPLRESLTEQGWSCWQPNVTGDSASAILAGIEAQREAARVTLPPAASAIGRVLPQLVEEGYDLLQPLETDL